MLFIRLEEWYAQERFKLTTLPQDSLVPCDETNTSALVRRVYMERVPTVVLPEDAADLAKVLGTNYVIKAKVGFIPSDVHVTPLRLRWHCVTLDMLASTVAIVGEVNENDAGTRLKRPELRC